jgi:hypothetical protein
MQAVMGPLLRALGMSCRDITELSAARLDRKLTLGETMKLRMHTIMCALCRPLPRQFANLRELVRHAHEDPSPDPVPGPELSAEARARIAGSLPADSGNAGNSN